MSAEPILTSDVFGLTKTAPFSRRGFMTASAAVAAGYTLAAGPVRADVIKTDTEGLDSGDTKIKVADGDMPGYFARPKGASNPPVVLVAMEIFGLHEYIKDVTRRLAKLGAFAVAPDYYFRKGGIIGFCRGGRTVWEYAAHNAGLKAGVAFYGPPVDPPNPLWPKSPTQLAPEMKAPVLGLYGEADTGIPVASVEALKAALAENKKAADFKIYPGAPARLPRRLSRELPQGGRRGCLESDAGLAQEIQRAGLTGTTATRPLVKSSGRTWLIGRPGRCAGAGRGACAPAAGRDSSRCRLHRHSSRQTDNSRRNRARRSRRLFLQIDD